MYLSGTGVPHDPAEAAHWLQQASTQGQANASLLLGKQYWNGDGVERNHERAAKLWRNAALRGNRSAPGLLAKHYLLMGFDSVARKIEREPAIKLVYWGTLAARSDPDAAARAEAQKLVDMALGVAPELRKEVDLLISSGHPPAE